jgi:hypothetical protein
VRKFLRVQIAAVRVLEQLKWPQTITVEEHYKEGETTCKEISKKIEASDQPHASAVSTLGKDPQHPLNRKPDGPQGWSDVLN